MQVERLYAEDFRNLERVDLELHDRFNIFEGRNGQGKTNLLEAIYLLASFKSFRKPKNVELVRFGAEAATLRAEVVRRGLTRTIGLEVRPKGRRGFLDGKVVTRLSSFFGHLSVVLFGPDDLALTKQGPNLRRDFLDRAVFNVWPSFLDEARAYSQALKSRNALLRERRGRSVDPTVMASFDAELCRRGARVLWRRLTFIQSFRTLFVQVLSDMTKGGLSGGIRYKSRVLLREEDDEATLEGAFMAALDKSRETDRRRGFTGPGPHSDDLDLSLDSRDVRTFASQGQHRAFVLALKIAEMMRIEDALGVCPVLLLDDVSSELDEARNRDLMHFLDRAGGQVFITTTDRRWIQLGGASKVFTVRAGKVDPAGGAA